MSSAGRAYNFMMAKLQPKSVHKLDIKDVGFVMLDRINELQGKVAYSQALQHELSRRLEYYAQYSRLLEDALRESGLVLLPFPFKEYTPNEDDTQRESR